MCQPKCHCLRVGICPVSSHNCYANKSAISECCNVAGEENLLGEPSYKYLTADEMRGLGDDSMAIDVTHDEKLKAVIENNDTIFKRIVEENDGKLRGEFGQEVKSGARRSRPCGCWSSTGPTWTSRSTRSTTRRRR